MMFDNPQQEAELRHALSQMIQKFIEHKKLITDRDLAEWDGMDFIQCMREEAIKCIEVYGQNHPLSQRMTMGFQLIEANEMLILELWEELKPEKKEEKTYTLDEILAELG